MPRVHAVVDQPENHAETDVKREAGVHPTRRLEPPEGEDDRLVVHDTQHDAGLGAEVHLAGQEAPGREHELRLQPDAAVEAQRFGDGGQASDHNDDQVCA